MLGCQSTKLVSVYNYIMQSFYAATTTIDNGFNYITSPNYPDNYFNEDSKVFLKIIWCITRIF